MLINRLRYNPNSLCLFSIKDILMVFVMFSLFRISKFIDFPYLYYTEYPTRLIGDWAVDYYFYLTDLILVLMGCTLAFIKKNYSCYCIVVAVTLINIGRFILGFSNPISLNSYEIILSLLVSASCISVIKTFYKTKLDLILLMRNLVIFCIATQVAFIILGRGSGFSYGALGIDSGGLGIIYLSYIFILLNEKNMLIELGNRLLIYFCCVGIFFTGSRTNILILIVVLIYYKLLCYKTAILKKIVVSSLLLFLTTILLYFNLDKILYNQKIIFVYQFLTSGSLHLITQDASFVERFDTVVASLGVLKDNPFGISCSVWDLQNRMFNFGATSFPHSFLLTYYLLLGVPFFLLYIYLIISFIFDKQNRFNLGIVLLITTFYGGVSTSYVFYTWIHLLFCVFFVDKTLNSKTKLI